MKVQDEREETEKALDEFRNDQLMFMNDMTKKIEEGRRRHKLLASQVILLLRCLELSWLYGSDHDFMNIKIIFHFMIQFSMYIY